MNNGIYAYFPDYFTYGMQINYHAVLQGDVHLEVKLPSLMHFRRRIGALVLDFLPWLPTEARPLMQIAPDLRGTGQPQPLQGVTLPKMVSDASWPPAWMLKT